MKQNKSMQLINKIQKIRSKNNINWMNMLKLAFKYDPKGASSLMAKIYTQDQNISELVKKLYENNIK